MNGHVVVLLGPSGVGKSTIRRAILQTDPNSRFACSITTRPPRPGEVPGRDYHFTDIQTFERLKEDGHLAEWSRYHGYDYGTFAEEIDHHLELDRSVIAELDLTGTLAFKQIWQIRCVPILVLPPSWQELERRLRGRGSDDERTIRTRLQTAPDEIRAAESAVEYFLLNGDVGLAVATIRLYVQDHRTPLAKTKDETVSRLVAHQRQKAQATLEELLAPQQRTLL